MTEPVFAVENKRGCVAGHNGMVRSAVVRRPEPEPVGKLITATSSEVDLRRQSDTERLVNNVRPDVAVVAAAKVVASMPSADGETLLDASMPDGTFRKLLDVSRLQTLGWHSSISLADGIAQTYRSYLNEHVGTSG